ncbi:hypothetical protein [Streptomyces viridochromogenes]|nr:hypothetical protein [Streptomyces viridochromogenes]
MPGKAEPDTGVVLRLDANLLPPVGGEPMRDGDEPPPVRHTR